MTKVPIVTKLISKHISSLPFWCPIAFDAVLQCYYLVVTGLHLQCLTQSEITGGSLWWNDLSAVNRSSNRNKPLFSESLHSRANLQVLPHCCLCLIQIYQLLWQIKLDLSVSKTQTHVLMVPLTFKIVGDTILCWTPLAQPLAI